MAPEHTTHTIDMAKANFRLSLTLGFFFVAFIAFDGKFFRVRVVLHRVPLSIASSHRPGCKARLGGQPHLNLSSGAVHTPLNSVGWVGRCLNASTIRSCVDVTRIWSG